MIRNTKKETINKRNKIKKILEQLTILNLHTKLRKKICERINTEKICRCMQVNSLIQQTILTALYKPFQAMASHSITICLIKYKLLMVNIMKHFDNNFIKVFPTKCYGFSGFSLILNCSQIFSEILPSYSNCSTFFDIELRVRRSKAIRFSLTSFLIKIKGCDCITTLKISFYFFFLF